jgi:RNase H-fold protein (predicted Holliday junction resolvase)
MKALGLDIGNKRIGIAVSDAFRCTGQGLMVLNIKAPEFILYQDLCNVQGRVRL